MSSSSSSASSALSSQSSSSSELEPEVNLMAIYEALAPEYWDAREWDFAIESEDDEPLTVGEEDLRFLVDGELEAASEDDLLSWEADLSSDEEEEEAEETDEDSSSTDKTLLDTTCSGSFTRNKEEFKRDLLDRIKENAEDWENDKGKESGYADKPPFKPLPPKEGNEEKEKKKKKGTKKKKKKKKENKEKEAMAYPRVYEVTIAAGGTFMSITLGAATKLLDDMMINYSEWHTERAPQGKKVNSVEETSSLNDKIDVIMSMLVNGRSNVDPNNVPLASLVAQEENVDVNFIKSNNFNNNAYRNNSGNNYRPYPSANGNGYGNSYGNSYNNNRSVPPGLEAMLKEFISTQTAFNKSVEEKLDKIDTIASRVDRLASDVNLLKLKVMPNNDIDNKITTTANAIQVRINENIRLMAELRARWDREENEKLAKENNVAKVWTITTTSNANSSHVAAPPTINGKIIGVGNVSTPSAKRTKLPEIAKTAETACDKTAEIFSNLGNNDPIAVAHNDLDFDDCHISEVIKFLQKLAKSPNASAINLAFTKHITNALIKAREEKLKLETSIPRKLEDGWEPIIKMKFNDFECNALCDLGASISVMPKKIYDMLDLPPLKNCYLDVNLADNVKKKPLGRIDNVHITVNNNLVPVDFVVLDIECNASCPIVLGRPFLRTVGAVIDMREAAGGTFMSITLGAATKLLDDMMINYSEWHTERAPQGKKVNSVEETSSLSDKIDVIMSMLVNGRSNVDPNNVPLASLVAQEENVDVNFIKNNNFNNNAYRNNSGNNYRPYPSANGNGYGNSYGNSYNNNRNVPSGLEAMLKEFISTQTAFNKSVEEKLDKIDTIASRVDRLASDVNLLKLKVMPNNDIDNKITTTANAIQVRINENIRLMAELRARWDREENEKLAKENNVAKVWTITTTSNANSSHVAAPPTINGKIIGVGNVSTPSAKRTKLPEIAKTAETACDKTAEIFSNLGNNDPIAVAHNDLDFDDCHISEVIKFLQKLAKSPNASAINLAFTKHITNALIKAREEKLKLETSIPRKLEDGWEPIIKMKFNDFECNALCDLGASISVMPKKIYDMLDLPPLKNCYLDVNLADNVKKKPLGRIDNVRITVNNNLVPVDFVVLDIECNASCPIVLGRPFLRTVGAVIDMREGSALAPESLVLRRITFRDHQPSTCFLAPTGLLERDIFDLFLPEFDKPWTSAGYPPAKRLRGWAWSDDDDEEEEDEAPAGGFISSDEEPAGSSADGSYDGDDEGSNGP
ncbi:hypothetical protein QYE76_021789 [Lolium multiflorum]|uniref:Reverse transcriptase domain-containing protein n=1 Tax=Lolium multiflorum TaxID=4521 RepID=A0AAD8R9P9_LOLMU|nr:hypothetical protein QYE76_021789 [Lolium multiflorum]